MILVWGLPDDPPTTSILEALGRARAPHHLVDQTAGVPEGARFRFGATVGGRLGSLDLTTVTAAFIRPHHDRPPAGAAGTPASMGELARFNHCLTAWTELTPALVVNRLSAQASNTSKLYQAAVIASAGFAVPDSLATTDPAAARAFVVRHPAVIYKSLSGVRSIVRRLGADELDRLADVRGCPTLFQGYVEGNDYRAHVIGHDVYATMVVSEEDDYRYDHLTERVAVQLPDPVAARCVRLAQTLGLALAGIDLRLTPAGTWVCFEVNPSPAFPYFEVETEMADAAATLLMRGA
ncbi:MAG: ATP-grasp domain-containing protein [Acidimicrobiales bacterium]